MDSQPVSNLGRPAEVALSQMLEAGRVIGRDSDGRRVAEVPVDETWHGSSVVASR